MSRQQAANVVARDGGRYHGWVTARTKMPLLTAVKSLLPSKRVVYLPSAHTRDNVVK